MDTIPRFFTGIAEFSAVFVYILFLPKRFNKVLTILLMIVFLFCQVGYQLFAGTLPLWLWVPGMIIAVGIMFLGFWSISKINLVSMIVYVAQAFILAEFTASISWQLYYYLFNLSPVFRYSWIMYVLLSISYLAIFSIFVAIESRYFSKKELYQYQWKDLFSILTIVITVFAIGNLSFVNSSTPLSGQQLEEIFYIRTLVDLCGIVLLISYHEQRMRIRANNRAQLMQEMLENQYEQFLISKNSIEKVNEKYHDMKHVINVIRKEEDVNVREQYLSQIEEEIKSYEAQSNTGNKILDIVLTGKNLVCLDNQIQFSSVIDGGLLNHMDPMDLCSLFGNALDNAIESVKKIEEKDRRVIKLSVYSKTSIIFIRFVNYYQHALVVDEGTFISTKRDKNNHGYGIKSIESIVHKYNGIIKISTNDNWFSLFIMLPQSFDTKANRI